MKVVQPFGKDAVKSNLRVSLCDVNTEMIAAWQEKFFSLDAIQILQGDLLDADADAVVSPANSFGDMSGGVDKHIDDFYKGAAQAAIMARIKEQFLGELPVGMALVVPMPSARLPFVIAAPTMRVPQQVASTVNAYLAMRAVLVAVQQHNLQSSKPIRSVAIPGLCTGVGRMDCATAALQMRIAYDNVVGEGWKDVLHPAMAPFALGNKPVRRDKS